MPKRRKMTDAERAEWEADRARMRENTLRLRRLAEKAQAELDAKKSGLIAVWLDPEDVEWLATHDPRNATDDEKARWERLRLSADAARQVAVPN